MAATKISIVQDYELKFKQLGLEGINTIIENVAKSVSHLEQATLKGVDLKVGIDNQSVAQVVDITKDLENLRIKQEEFNKSQDPATFKEILELTKKIEEKIKETIKTSFAQGTIFKENGKDMQLLTKNVENFKNELVEAKKDAIKLDTELKKIKTEAPANNSQTQEAAKKIGLTEKDLTTDGASMKLSQIENNLGGKNKEGTIQQKKQIEFLKNIIVLNQEHEKKLADIAAQKLINTQKQDALKESIKETNLLIKQQKSSWSPTFEALVEIGDRITENSKKAQDLILNFEKIKTEFPQKLETLSAEAGVNVGSVDTMDKAKAQLEKRKEGSANIGQSKADYDAEIAGLEKIVQAHKTYQQSLKNTEKEMKVNAAGLKKNKREYENASKALETVLKEAEKAGTISPETIKKLRDLINSMKAVSQITFDETTKSLESLEQGLEEVGKEQSKVSQKTEEAKKGFVGAAIGATIYFAAIRALRKLISEIVKTVTELDKSLTQVSMVTGMTRDETWKLVDGYQNLARQVGSTTTEIAKLSVFFFRQGLAQKDALIMTEVAATAAKVASIDATESANFLTSAINGFGLASSDAMKVSDKFAALGAASASSYEELAVALSKVAPVAKVAGVGIDQMMGFLAKGVETTREAPENIGTAFKTVFARMTQLTDFGKTLEDNTSVNAVEEALALANVALRDSQGTFRNMGDVITELGLKFDGLDRNTQSYIATALAGTRQQSRLLAVLQDFGRTQELVDVSTNSAGATMRQHAAFARSMEAAMNNLTTSFQMLITKISDSQTIIDFVNMLARSIDVVGSVMGFMVNATDSAIANIGIFVTSLTVLATIFLFLRSSVIKYIATQKVQNALIAAENFLVKKQIGSKKTLATIQSLINVEQKKGLVTTLLTITSEKIRLILLKRMNIGQAALVVTNAATATSNTLVATTSKAVGVGFAAAAKGLWTLLWPLGLLLLALIVSIAPLVLLGFALDALIVTSEESAKALGELNETIFKLQETKVDMTQKIDRFEELRDKVFKTNEELIEMQELIKDINRMGAEAGMKDPVIGFDLSVNREGLENQLNLGISAAEKEAGKHARNLIGTFFHRVGKQNKKFLTLSEDQKMAFTREIAKNMLGVDEEALKKMTADELEQYGKRLEVLTVSVRSNLVDMHEKHKIDDGRSSIYGPTQLTLTDFSFKVLSKGDMALTNAQITEIQTLVDNIDLEGLTSKFDSLTDTQKIFARSLFGNLDGLVTALREGDISEQVIKNLGGLQRVSRMIVSLSQVKTSEGLKLNATEMGLFLDALSEADTRFPDSIPEKVSFFSNAVKALGEELGIAVPQLEALKLNLMGDYGLNDSELQKDLNKVKNTGEEARRIMNAALRLQKGEALDDDMIDLQVNYSDLMEKITEGSLTYADVVARVATITKADLEERVRQAALARDALDPTTDAFRKAQDEFLAFQRLLLSYDTFVSESAGEGDSEKRLNVFKPQIDAIKQEIALRKQLNQQHNDEIDAIQKKMDLQKSQLDLDRRIAALKKDTSIGAQAELAKAEDQKRRLTVDQNKFIRDSAMKEEIALLEAQKQSLMVSQQEETNRILLETLEENRRARQNQTFNPFASTTGS